METIGFTAGDGIVKDYDKKDKTPWNYSRYTLKTVYFEQGVSSIGRSMFFNRAGLTTVHISDSVMESEITHSGRARTLRRSTLDSG